MFCTRFADNFGRLKDRAGEVRAKIVERRDGRIQKFKDKRNQRDENWLNTAQMQMNGGMTDMKA